MTYHTLAQLRLETEECCNCHMVFAMPAEFRRRKLDNPGTTFHCPAGHAQHYTGKSAEQKLRDAEARETSLRDQLRAAEADAERTRVRLARDQHRFANGVCPCCNRTFPNVAAHMRTKHPDYDPGVLHTSSAPRYKCSCGRGFETPHGLAIHQGRNRRDNWTDPAVSKYSRHLTVGV